MSGSRPTRAELRKMLFNMVAAFDASHSDMAPMFAPKIERTREAAGKMLDATKALPTNTTEEA